MSDIRSAAVEVKTRVSALEAGRKMGLRPDAHGFCKCPFHQEKTGSLRLYDGQRGFYCFGCGASGSVIDLAMRFYGIGFKQALMRLDLDHNLGLSLFERPMTYKDRMEARRRLEEEEAKRRLTEIRNEILLSLYWAWGDLFNLYRDAAIAHRPGSRDAPWDPAFADAIRNMQEARDMMNHYAVQVIGRAGG